MGDKKLEYTLNHLSTFLKAWNRLFDTEWIHIDEAVRFYLFDEVGYKGLWWYIINRTEFIEDKEIKAGKFYRITRKGLCFIGED